VKLEHWVILVLLIIAGYAGYNRFFMPPPAPAALSLALPKIDLLANPGQNELQPQNRHNCNAANTKLGCVGFAVGDIGAIIFDIQNGGNQHATCLSIPKPNWVITEVRLTDKVLAPATDEKGDFSQTVDTWVEQSFPQINPTTRVVYHADLNFASRTAIVLDLNVNNAADGAKTAYYEVTASTCDGATLKTDPMVRNDGK